MRRTRGRLRLCSVLLISTLLFIWGNSLLPSGASGAFSQWVANLVNGVFPATFPQTQNGGSLLRKLAHLAEFCLLGMCLSWLFGMLRSKPWEQITFPALLGFLVACIDETIQRFVPGRYSSLFDVGIDIAGVITGIILFFFGYLIFKRIHQHLEETS